VNSSQLMEFCDPLDSSSCTSTCCRSLTTCTDYTCDPANGFTTNTSQSNQYCDDQNIGECQVRVSKCRPTARFAHGLRLNGTVVSNICFQDLFEF
jgi:hypothetical protein